MDVTDILRDRMQEPEGLQRTTMVSFVLHGALMAVLLFAPSGWLSSARGPDSRTVMTITLGGGSPGPQAGGITSIAGRPVQVQVPPEESRRPEPVRPPAAKPPEMTLPKPDATPTRKPPPPSVEQAPPEARGSTPTRGENPTPGSSVAETGARGQGFGLSTGGGGGSGSHLDVANFCCPDYLTTMVERIRRHWEARAEVPGEVVVVFTIQRDGSITGVSVERSSGYAVLDINAHRAILSARQLPQLPAEFTNPTLTVHLNFQYTR
jgi:TonB family protein